MTSSLPSQASVVVIGGGVIGASVAYHLARQGCQDVLLLERCQFSCGTTWHAAGLMGTVRANENHARLAEYSLGLLHELETETGQATGFRRVGSLSVAHSTDRFQELQRIAAMNNAFGVTRVDVITAAEVQHLYPLVEASDLLGGTWVAQDGHASPVDVTMAFIKGARQRGVQCLEGITVTAIHQHQGRVSGVGTDHGDIRCDYVVNAAGMWSRTLGRLAGVNVPLHACEHYYAHTEKRPEFSADLPVLRDHDRSVYFREDAGSLLVGIFEPQARPWGMHGIPENFCFDELPGHVEEQLLPILEDAMLRLPILADTGWQRFFCGPESFTPDDQFHLGEAPELRGFFVVCGLNSIGIQSAGGVGKVLAEWLVNGHPPLDLWSNDIRRMYPFQGTQAYLQQRVTETLGLLYANHYPYRQFATARNVRHSPLHERLAEHGACFGEAAGWERPNWYAPPGVEPRYEYRFGKQNWFPYSAAEHRAAREGVALFDQSSFAKYRVQGRHACRELQRLCSADVDVEIGRAVYTLWLNERGTIEADLTVTRLADNDFLIVSAAARTIRDLDWLQRHIDPDAHCVVSDVSSGLAVLGVMGPGSRALLESISATGLDNATLPFGHSCHVEIGCVPARAQRLSYVGELGYELYLPTDQARHAFDVLWQAGADVGLQLAGMHALDSCRLEKAFRHIGHDIGDEDSPRQAGLRFACNMDKAIPFLGRDAVLAEREREATPTKRLVQFLLHDPEAILYHHEPILRDGKIVGHLSSGNYGHSLGGAVGLGYVHHRDGVSQDYLDSGRFEIDVGGQRIPATASLKALYDPKGERMRG